MEQFADNMVELYQYHGFRWTSQIMIGKRMAKRWNCRSNLFMEEIMNIWVFDSRIEPLALQKDWCLWLFDKLKQAKTFICCTSHWKHSAGTFCGVQSHMYIFHCLFFISICYLDVLRGEERESAVQSQHLPVNQSRTKFGSLRKGVWLIQRKFKRLEGLRILHAPFGAFVSCNLTVASAHDNN